MNKEILLYKKPTEIKPDPKNPRKGDFDKEELKNMAETFKHHGIIQPIEIDENNNIICGELRWRASKIANMEKIPCKQISGLNNEQKLERQLIENFHRQKVDLGECIDEIKMLLGTVQHPKHINNGKEPIGILANRLGVNRNWLSELLQIDNAPESIKKDVQKYFQTKDKPMAEREGISPSQAVEIIKAPRIIQEDLHRKAKDQTPSKRLRQYRQDFEKKKVTLEKIRESGNHEPRPLNFRKNHIDMIKNGKKTQTTRFWHNAREGDKVDVHLHEPNVSKVEILTKEKKKLKDFTEDDAKREGGYTLEEFKDVWRQIHGSWNPNSEVIVYKFKVV